MAGPERRRPPASAQRTLFGSAPADSASMDDANGEVALGPDAPLAARMRPRSLDEFVGQAVAVGPGTTLMRAIGRNELPSLILWGPPGCGKTTLARLLADAWQGRFVSLSAVTAGVADVRRVVSDAQAAQGRGERTVLFLDEIHRFSRSQQDALLPHVERGTVRLIGATTENPSFEVNGALLSRCRVVRMATLDEEAMRTIVRRALEDTERGLGGRSVTLTAEGEEALVAAAGGDARVALGALETAAAAAPEDARGVRVVGREAIEGALLRRLPRHDRAGDAHYDTISALIKSVRGSDADAAVYWLARLLEAGEDPLFVARRLVLLAAEDVGLADPAALPLAVAAFQAAHAIGMPECYLPLSEAALYLALAPKSNSAYLAYGRARKDVEAHPDVPVPLHLRNAPTALMRAEGYGEGYRYAHDAPEGVATQRHLPEEIGDPSYYRPVARGAESALAARWERLRPLLRGRQAAGGEGGGQAPMAGEHPVPPLPPTGPDAEQEGTT